MSGATISEIVAELDGAPAADGFLAHCPAHEDSTPSLSITESGGKILVHCHAGCTQDAVIAAMKERGLWTSGNGDSMHAGAARGKGRPPKPKAVPIPEDALKQLNHEIYSPWSAKNLGEAVLGSVYRDAESCARFCVVRFRGELGKTIRPYFFGEDGKFHEGQAMPDSRPFLRLPEVLAAPDARVVVVEGEACAEVEIPGYIVVTWAGGSSATTHTDWSALLGRDVTIWGDADKKYDKDGSVLPWHLQPGMKAALTIQKFVPNARILDVRKYGEQKDGWDVCDAQAEGVDVGVFVETCPVLELSTVDGERKAESSDEIAELFNYSNGRALCGAAFSKDQSRAPALKVYFARNIEVVHQLAAAKIFEELRGADHCAGLKLDGNTVFHYRRDRHYWEPYIDLTRPKDAFAPLPLLEGNERVIQQFGADFTFAPVGGRPKTRHFDRTATSRNRECFVQYCASLLKPDPAFLQRKPGKTISCENGLLLYRDGDYVLEPHAPEHFQQVPSFPFRYMPWDTIPIERRVLVTEYLEKLFRNVPREQFSSFMVFGGFLIGYTLTPFRAKRFFVFIGDNDSGKTFLMEIVRSLHTETGTAADADFQKMQKHPGDFDWVPFKRTLVVMNDDFPPAGELPAYVLKKAANPNTRITINEKFRPPFEQVNTAACFIDTNENPTSPDPYIANRLCAVPCDAAFTDEEQLSTANITFLNRVCAPEMREVFFNFGIECLRQFFAEESIDGLLPPLVKERTAAVTGSLNDIDLWITESVSKGILMETQTGRADRRQLYKLYEQTRKKPYGRNTFYMILRRRYSETKSGEEFFHGLHVTTAGLQLLGEAVEG